MKKSEDPTSARKSAIANALTSESFIEKVSLVLITALLSGLLIPFISTTVQTRKAKNEQLLQSQSKLFDEVANTLLTYESLALSVSYYKSGDSTHNPERHKASFIKYSEKSADLFAQLRLQVVKTKHLASPVVSEKLEVFHDQMMDIQDTPMSKLIANGTVDEWVKMHDANLQMGQRANELVDELATDLQIGRSNQ